MQTTVRTTIRIRKDLLDKSRQLAFNRRTSQQKVISDALSLGFSRMSDTETQKKAFARIDKFRENLKRIGIKVDVQKLIGENKEELQERTNRVLGLSKDE